MRINYQLKLILIAIFVLQSHLIYSQTDWTRTYREFNILTVKSDEVIRSTNVGIDVMVSYNNENELYKISYLTNDGTPGFLIFKIIGEFEDDYYLMKNLGDDSPNKITFMLAKNAPNINDEIRFFSKDFVDPHDKIKLIYKLSN